MLILLQNTSSHPTKSYYITSTKNHNFVASTIPQSLNPSINSSLRNNTRILRQPIPLSKTCATVSAGLFFPRSPIITPGIK